MTTGQSRLESHDTDEAVEVTVDRGYMGDENAWCFWETEYPDEGSCGPFVSRRDAEQEAKAQGYVVPCEEEEL